MTAVPMAATSAAGRKVVNESDVPFDAHVVKASAELNFHIEMGITTSRRTIDVTALPHVLEASAYTLPDCPTVLSGGCLHSELRAQARLNDRRPFSLSSHDTFVQMCIAANGPARTIGRDKLQDSHVNQSRIPSSCPQAFPLRMRPAGDLHTSAHH